MIALISVINLIFRFYSYLLLARILISWVGTDRNNQLIDTLCRVTDPVMVPCRDLLFSVLGALGVDMRKLQIDFSPILAFLAVDLVRKALIQLILLSAG